MRTHHPGGKSGDFQGDYALVKLKGKVPSVEPLPVSSALITTGDQILGIMSHQADLLGSPHTEPPFVACSALQIYERPAGRFGYFSDCDMAKGGSSSTRTRFSVHTTETAAMR